MNCKRRITVVVLAFWATVIGVTYFFLWREDHQEHVNQQLLAAIKHENTSAALLALKLGADANVRDEARVSVWRRICELFLGHRPAPSTAKTPILILLDQYQSSDKPELITALVAHGARINEADEVGFTPIWQALTSRKTASALILIECGANVTPETADKHNSSHLLQHWLLTMAIEANNTPDVVESLLQHGADPNQADLDGLTVLGVAVQYENPRTVQCLLRVNADPNRTTKFYGDDSTRPLEYALKHHLTEIAIMLRKAGAKR
jgi:ankyrin repeat protein